jgi:hypothetical protein
VGPRTGMDSVVKHGEIIRNEFRNVYSSVNIIIMVITSSMRWAGYVAHTWERRNPYRM